MTKTHKVNLTIRNVTPYAMIPTSYWFDTGGFAEGQNHKSIPAHGEETLEFCETFMSLVGCSGYVTYSMNNDFITIAFSNPLNPATNKLNIGTSGKQVWDDMDDTSYKSFTRRMILSGKPILANCSCTGGDKNMAVVIIKQETETEPDSTGGTRDPKDVF